jgi:hypothetical protein
LPKESGVCDAIIPRFHFDPEDRACKEFLFGGCGGNENNFETKKDCEKACEVYEGSEMPNGRNSNRY